LAVAYRISGYPIDFNQPVSQNLQHFDPAVSGHFPSSLQELAGRGIMGDDLSLNVATKTPAKKLGSTCKKEGGL
jgi:hypothetical protein